MKKFLGVIIVIIFTFVCTAVLFETGVFGGAREVVTNTATDTGFAIAAGTSYRKFVESANARAEASGFTGVLSESVEFGDEVIEFSAHYINGVPVTASEYNSYTSDLVKELEAENAELNTFSGFFSHKLGIDK